LIVSHKVLYIRPSDQSFSARTKPAYKYGPGSVEEGQLSQRGRLFAGGRVRSLNATSLPLPPTSSQYSQTACTSGAQNGFHRQAAARCRSAGAADCSRAPSVHQRFGHRGIGGFSDKTQTPWLSPTAHEPSMFNSNAAMIVIPRRSWRRFIGFSSLAMNQAAKLRNF
jgi:hypothetical protein